ncbi:MAG: transcription elongation factor GreA [Proteobacteria bacterium]|jgi:transcription elongation factor GreA|nr:transcription elongation factor GreA [Pseudomonadota bacterium]
MNRVPLTPEGKEKLADELSDMKKVQRPKVISEISAAREHGDLKENAEYHAAREKQSLLEGRILQFEDVLSRAEVIDAKKFPNDKVIFGMNVTVFDETIDKEKVYRIVGELEADTAKGLLSVSSPIAKALIGKKVGDVASVQVPGGTKDLEIVKISS